MRTELPKGTVTKTPEQIYLEAARALNDGLSGQAPAKDLSLDERIEEFTKLFTTAEEAALACTPNLLPLFDETKKLRLSVLEAFCLCARKWGNYLSKNYSLFKGPRAFEENQFYGFRRHVADCSVDQIGRVVRLAKRAVEERDFSDQDCRFGVAEPLIQWLFEKNHKIKENPSSQEAVEGKKILFFLFDLVKQRPLMFDIDRPYRPLSPVERRLEDRVESRLGSKAAAVLCVHSPRRAIVIR